MQGWGKRGEIAPWLLGEIDALCIVVINVYKRFFKFLFKFHGRTRAPYLNRCV